MRGVQFALCLVIATLAQPGKWRPSGKESDQAVQCHACRTVLNETLKKLRPMLHAGTKFPITKAIGEPCAQENFNSANYPPHVMARACGMFFASGTHQRRSSRYSGRIDD